MWYRMARSLLFRLEPETTHRLTLSSLARMPEWMLKRCFRPVPRKPVTVMGLDFDNPVGLAAGFDKNGDYMNVFGAMGFGFIELGTITPRPQSGNNPPRLFRLPNSRALINRMGFNNKGVEHLVSRLQKRRYSGIVGINIGKNAVTPLERAEDDYTACLTAVYPYADYITVNISSPNTQGLRTLQEGQGFQRLLTALVNCRAGLQQKHGRYCPLLIKFSPDLDRQSIQDLVESLVDYGLDGIVAVNTTLSREGLSVDDAVVDQEGGLSGAPLTEPAVEITKDFIRAARGRLSVIGAGGIMSADDIVIRKALGVNLVQLYTGLVYQGPGLVRQAVNVW